MVGDPAAPAEPHIRIRPPSGSPGSPAPDMGPERGEPRPAVVLRDENTVEYVETKPIFPGCSVERPLWAWLRPRLTWAEASGSVGDLGTFLPITLAMQRQLGLSFSTSLLFAGLYNILTGLHFSVPMAVQPMKAIAAVALKENLSVPQVMAAGILVAAALLVLGATGLVEVVNRVTPAPVIKGIQLGLGLSFLQQGFAYATASGAAWGGPNLDCALVAAAAASFVLAAWPFRRVPAALLLFLAGLACAAAGLLSDTAAPRLSFGPGPVSALVPSADDFRVAFFRAAIPQIPLTTLNSVVAVAALASELFPKRPTRPAAVAVAVALMNLTGGWFGSAPYCHGAGGLAGQYRFGARSNVSILLLGAAKILCFLLFGASAAAFLRYFPGAILGVLLGASGMELASSVRDQAAPRAIAVALLTAAAVLLYQTSVGFAVGLYAAALLEAAFRFAEAKGPASQTFASLFLGPRGLLALLWPPLASWRDPSPARPDSPGSEYAP
eukprot:tig00021126_g18457.t1